MRGLAVIKFFTGLEDPVTISEISRGTGYDRAVVRRILGTLETVGYVDRKGAGFVLNPTVLELGYAYLSSDPLPSIAEARLRPLASKIQESSSFGVLQQERVVYLARVQIKRITGPILNVGTMMDPYLTAVGRMLLAGLSSAELDSYLAHVELRPVTPRTVVDPGRLRAEVELARDRGWCLVEDQVELGLLAAAMPVRSASGATVGAINVTSHTSRTTAERFIEEILPELRTTVRLVEADLQHANYESAQ
ncbi:MAG TPA: IclR family transcriptional regulator C-terminal domain-containing protein [Amycolatopsis sp.]|nr:IclR family transcriptional regulator C-terminal domain-containing protein [Amycolatopsis sp.]